MKRWPHQLRVLSETDRLMSEGIRRICVTAPTGAGKSLIMVDEAERAINRGQRVGLLTPRKLLTDQIIGDFEQRQIPFSVRAAGYEDYLDDNRPIQICSALTEHSRVNKTMKLGALEADLLLIDECFTGDTEVLTGSGHRRIDNVRTGDTVYTACGFGTVESVFCRKSDDLYRVEMSDGTATICTGDHRFFTHLGWIAARALGKGAITFGPEDLLALWHGVHPAEVEVHVREEVRDAGGQMATADMLLSVLLQEAGQSNEQIVRKRKNAAEDQRTKVQAHKKGRKRAIAATASACFAARLGARLGGGGSGANWDCSAPLQDRHRKQGVDDSHRGGWREPQLTGQAGAGCEEVGDTGWTRVVSCSRLQRACPEVVYNLHVSGHPSYYANGHLVHNCHMQQKGVVRNVIEQNYNAGATVIGYTATPLNLKKMYDRLVVGGTPSELRQLGALLPAKLYDAGCPDLSKVKRRATGDFVTADLQKAGYVQTIIGKVVDHYKRLNPHGLPTILFAPGLPESKWFVDQFDKAGIHAAHIDGDDIYVDGQEHRRSSAAKDQLLADVASGRVKVICNRFVCREGVNIPELYYGILACPIGSLTSYIQAIGRLLRAHPTMGEVRVADHGGNIHRHGSPNEDRDWEALWCLTSVQVESARKLQVEAGKKEPGFVCKQCGLVWGRIPPSGHCECGNDMSATFECYSCGHKHKSWPANHNCQACGESLRGVRKRMVVQSDGTLVEVPDEAYKARRVRQVPGSEELWRSWYWRFRRHRPGKSLSQAWGGFCKEHWERFHCEPPRTLKLMPRLENNWFMPVGTLTLEELL